LGCKKNKVERKCQKLYEKAKDISPQRTQRKAEREKNAEHRRESMSKSINGEHHKPREHRK
jgi:hypothetical protein